MTTGTDEITIAAPDTTVSDTVKGEVLMAQAGIVLLDYRLLEFAKEHLHQGAHAWTLKYEYRPHRDTLFTESADSIIVYSYPVDSITAFYGRPFTFMDDEYIQFRSEVKEVLPNLMGALSKALSCQGLIYSFGDQMVESFSFGSTEEAALAKSYFDDMNGWVFPKTLSFASHQGSRLYVFHARYNGPSWSSKKDHARFEKFLNEHHSENHADLSTS